MTELATAPGEIGIYVHWPYCARICPYCDFNVVRDRGQAAQAALAEAIVTDIRRQAAGLGRRRLISVFFGGGTPSLMAPEWVAAIVGAARDVFEPAPDLEVSLEANPTDAEAARFAAFASAGVNRLSLGVQSLDDAALAFLGRNHTAAGARRAAEIAARAFSRFSLDLIYALPGQSVGAWKAALAEAARLGAEHISAYQLTLEPGTPFDRAVTRGRWSPPEADAAGDLYAATDEVLSAAGYEGYEVSNHARGVGARSRHNLIYWRGGDYLGVGPGAHGRIGQMGERWSTLTPRGVADYVEQVERQGCGACERVRLSPVEVAQERLLMGLRTVEGVSRADLAALEIDPEIVGQLADGGYLAADGARLIATRQGRAVLDRITLELARGATAS